MSIGQNYFAQNFSMLGNPIATEPLNPNSASYGTSTGMTALLQALEASTYEFEGAAYNPSINGTPQNGAGYLATSANYQPQFPSYSPFGLNSDPYFSSMGSSGSGSGGFSQIGETNPYFNAGFSGAMSGFYGNEGQGQSGQTGQWGQWGQGQSGQTGQWGQGSQNGCSSTASTGTSSSGTSSTGHHHHHHHHHGQSQAGSSSGAESGGQSQGWSGGQGGSGNGCPAPQSTTN